MSAPPIALRNGLLLAGLAFFLALGSGREVGADPAGSISKTESEAQSETGGDSASAVAPTSAVAGTGPEATAEAQEPDPSRPATETGAEAHSPVSPPLSSSPSPPPPPVGLRFAEALEGDTIRVGYRWTRAQSQGLVAGDDDLTPDFARDVLGFTSTPRSLEVTVHTFEIAYAPHPRVTLVANVPFVQRELERVDNLGQRRQEQTEGVGDISFALVIPFIRKGNEFSQIHVGFDAPTGSIRRRSSGRLLPYDSQIGNGTWDLEWGWTYQGEWQRVSWGGQAYGRHSVGRNGRKYRQGSRFVGTLWGAARIFDTLSLSLRTEWEKQNNISGFDRALDARADPSENEKARGGTRISLAPGLAVEVPGLSGQRLSVEVAVPVYQNLDGPQLERDWTVAAAWQWVY